MTAPQSSAGVRPAVSVRAPPAPPSHGLRLVPLLALLGLGALIYLTGWYRFLSLESVVKHRAALDDFVSAHALPALAIYIAAYAMTVALSIPSAAVLTIVGGVLFGGLLGGAASVVAATAGATVLFLIARGACGEFVLRRAGPMAAKLAAAFRAHGFFYLLFLRLVPVFPFCLVNIAPALARVRLRTFVAATVLGIVPASFIFAYVGAGLDAVIAARAPAYRACLAAGGSDCGLGWDPGMVLTPKLLIALSALALLAVAPVALRRLRSQIASTEPSA